MLAGDLVPQLREAGAKLCLTDQRSGSRDGLNIEALDITDRSALKERIGSFGPEWIVNCAAYTQVDKAETDYNTAFEVNAAAVEGLARCAKETNAMLLHVSTDYVFGAGTAKIPLSETDTPKPCGIYGHSKRYGEDLLLNILPDHSLLIRTSWLHGIHGPNFVDTMLNLSKEKTSLKVVNDQFGSPTWTGWLATVIVKLIIRNAKGIYHASSRGNITWFDFAKEIFRQAHVAMEVLPQTTEELNRPAPRPPFSVLDVSKLERLLGEVCISWQDCVAKHLTARMEKHA